MVLVIKTLLIFPEWQSDKSSFLGIQLYLVCFYKGFENLIAEDVADAVFFVGSRKARVNINDLIIMPQAQPIASVIHRK